MEMTCKLVYNQLKHSPFPYDIVYVFCLDLLQDDITYHKILH